MLRTALLVFSLLASLAATSANPAETTEALDIGSRLELFVDDYLIERLGGRAKQRLHRPARQGVAMVTDRPWEGNASHWRTVFRDGDRYRMYYMGGHFELEAERMSSFPHGPFLCYAESDDGIHWRRPDLGLVEFQDSRQNNILLAEESFPDLELDPAWAVPFRDPNPDVPGEARYKALVFGSRGGWRDEPRGLYALQSADGIHFSPMKDQPVITRGVLDSQNLAFWDSVRGQYRAYTRDFRDGVMSIRTSVSSDFLGWPEPDWIEFPGSPSEHLYTNQILPYHRAPHLFVGFPMRYNDRGWPSSALFVNTLAATPSSGR